MPTVDAVQSPHQAVRLQRVREEYEEMPCLRLTLPQACRLFGLEADEATRILATLIDGGLLKRTGTGQYVRIEQS
jgi:DNA-binding IclR family transcriptional regulator